MLGYDRKKKNKRQYRIELSSKNNANFNSNKYEPRKKDNKVKQQIEQHNNRDNKGVQHDQLKSKDNHYSVKNSDGFESIINVNLDTQHKINNTVDLNWVCIMCQRLVRPGSTFSFFNVKVEKTLLQEVWKKNFEGCTVGVWRASISKYKINW